MADDLMPQPGQPVQFSWLPDFSVSGVYFLHWQGEIVYVGQSKNARKRIASHLAEGAKSFDAVSFVPLKHGLNRIERHYIRTLTPKYNQCALAKESRMLRAAGYTGGPVERRSRKPEARNQRIADDRLIGPKVAASYLSLRTEQFRLLLTEGLVPRPTHRANARSGWYRAGEIRMWAEANADLLRQLQERFVAKSLKRTRPRRRNRHKAQAA